MMLVWPWGTFLATVFTWTRCPNLNIFSEISMIAKAAIRNPILLCTGSSSTPSNTGRKVGEITPDWMTLHYKAPCTHIHNKGQFNIDKPAYFWTMGGNWRPLGETYANTVRTNLHTDSNPSSGSNQGCWSCEVAILPTACSNVVANKKMIIDQIHTRLYNQGQKNNN